MLRSLHDLIGYELQAKDGEVGRVHDTFFDDREWFVRYLVADTERRLRGAVVLLAPEAAARLDAEARAVHLHMDSARIEKAPPVETEAPVSRQQERRLFAYYGWRPYWLPTSLPMDEGPEMAPVRRNAPAESEGAREIEGGDPHLRSLREVIHYDVRCTDGDAGVVSDLAVDDETWAIHYLVVDTHRWLPGHKVLVASEWISGIDWAENRVDVDLLRDAIRESPAFDPDAPIDRHHEERLYDFYGRPRDRG